MRLVPLTLSILLCAITAHASEIREFDLKTMQINWKEIKDNFSVSALLVTGHVSLVTLFAIQSHPQGEVRGATKLVKIPEDVRKFAAEQQISEKDAIKRGLEQKAREFTEAGNKIYSKA